MTTQPAYRRKLIEVDLPLDAINAESAREKSIRHGHPSTLHLWWSRKPLAACRAVIFASMVDDPSSCVDEFPDEEAQRNERERLHELIKRLVIWENTDESKPQVRELLNEARYEISKSVARSRGETAPIDPSGVLAYLAEKSLPIYDPFCGGGSIPLEVQRLGLKAKGSDLNPVAVLITKALIELPPKFANHSPVNPDADKMGMTVGKGKNQEKVPWRGAAGLADDIRYYGRKMREMAWERIGDLYPKARLPDDGEATVIAWLWARTVPCPNPACGIEMPLKTTFQLSKKRGNEHWTRPVVDHVNKTISFEVQNHNRGVPAEGTVNRNGATCLACGSTSPLSYVREQATAGNMSEVMTGIVAEGDRKRLFLSPTAEHIKTALAANPDTRYLPQQRIPTTTYKVSALAYGTRYWKELFSQRQLTGHAVLGMALNQIRQMMAQDNIEPDYINAVSTYLALALGRNTDSCSKYATWQNVGDKVAHVFSRQAIGMVWDFAEANPFSESTQNWMGNVEWVSQVVERIPISPIPGIVHHADAAFTIHADNGPVIVTDPPYYDNISYAELSDYFYVWLRLLLRDIYPELFSGILVPTQEEMIAAPRFDEPRARFEHLLNKTLQLIKERCSPEFPSSIFYAYKQQEEEREGRASTGWETMLSALIKSQFQIVGTWPMRTERAARSNALAANSLASSVVLVCRPRDEGAPTATRRQFLDALERELPAELDHLTREGHIAPVDLAQAAIGPGMKIYSRYSRVETISGEEVPVREALAAINRVIAEYDEQAQGELDPESRFCIDWVKQNSYNTGEYGQADNLARAKGTAVDSLRDNHRLLVAVAGSVSLLPEDEYGPNRKQGLQDMTAWEGCLRMAYHLDPNREDGAGIDGAATIARAMGSNAESVERLARILYNHYDRKGDSRNSVNFNNLVTEWSQILQRAQEPGQERLV